jgi:hypothetical protein
MTPVTQGLYVVGQPVFLGKWILRLVLLKWKGTNEEQSMVTVYLNYILGENGICVHSGDSSSLHRTGI